MKTISINKEHLYPDKAPTSVYFTMLFVLCFIGSAIGGTVSTLMSVYLPVVVKDLQGNLSPQQLNDVSGYINAVFIFGWAFGGFTYGVINDRIGRKKGLLLAMFCYGVFAILTGLMPTWMGVSVCRFMSGFGVGGVLVSTFTLLSEIWPSKSKAIYMGILSIAFPVGIFSAGLINYLVPFWRNGFLIGVVPVLLAFLGALYLKESAIWLAHRNANQTMRNPISVALSGKYRKEILIGSVIFGAMLIGLWAIFSWLPTWIQSLITTSDANKERGLSMMFLGMGGLTGGFLSGWLVNLIGLRQSMLLCFSVCSLMSFILFKTNVTFTNIVYLEIAVLALFFGASQGVLSVFIPQLFPTAIRATATGFCFNIGRLFTALAVLFIGVLVTVLGGFGNSLFIFSFVFIVGLLVVIFIKKKEFIYKSEVQVSADA